MILPDPIQLYQRPEGKKGAKSLAAYAYEVNSLLLRSTKLLLPRNMNSDYLAVPTRISLTRNILLSLFITLVIIHFFVCLAQIRWRY